MDFAIALISLVGHGLLFIATSWAMSIALFAGAAACLFAVHLVLVQPRQPRDEAGMSAQVLSLIMATPIFIGGLALIYWCVARSSV